MARSGDGSDDGLSPSALSLLRGVAESPEVLPEDDLVGTVVAERYTIVARLGRGGMGVVYASDDANLGRRLALKALPNAWGLADKRLAVVDEMRAILGR